jgi:hypothetical protein
VICLPNVCACNDDYDSLLESSRGKKLNGDESGGAAQQQQLLLVKNLYLLNSQAPANSNSDTGGEGEATYYYTLYTAGVRVCMMICMCGVFLFTLTFV